MSHALATHLASRDLNATLFTHHALVLLPLVLSAQALEILDRSKDLRAEQTVALRFQRSIVNRLRFLDLAVRPTSNHLGDAKLICSILKSSSLCGERPGRWREHRAHSWPRESWRRWIECSCNHDFLLSRRPCRNLRLTPTIGFPSE